VSEVAATSVPPDAPAQPPRGFRRVVRRTVRFVLRAIAYFTGVCMLMWATLAVYYADTRPSSPRPVLAVLFFLAAVGALFFFRPRKFRWPIFLLLFAIVLIWYLTLKPRSDRDWAIDVSKVASADIDGNRVVVHNIRNFDYHTSDEDFTPRWEDRTYNLANLRGADFFLSYWGGKNIAHGIVSFEFDDGRCLAVSIETRREKGESYSAVQGFFRQFELIYVFADERDLIRVRTNFRNEQVYLYHSTLARDQAQEFLLAYLNGANRLAQQPEWYNALTDNCVTTIIYLAQETNPTAALSWETLLAGHAAHQAYRNKRIDTSMPFEELEAKSRITDKAKRVDNAADFSRRIREGLPDPRPR
jgi:hypothetical protein